MPKPVCSPKFILWKRFFFDEIFGTTTKSLGRYFRKPSVPKKNGARRREFRSTETNLNLSHPIRRTTTQKKSRLHGSFCVSAAVSCHLSLSLSFFRSVASQWPHRFFWDRGCKIRDILEIPAFFHDHPAQISMSNNSSQYRMNESDVR